MRLVFGPFLVGVFVLSCTTAWGGQGSTVPIAGTPIQSATQPQAIQIAPPANALAASAPGCTAAYDALRTARQDVERERRDLQAAPDPGSAISPDEMVSATNLERDLISLDLRQSEFNQCAASNSRMGTVQDPLNGCSSEPLLNFQISHHGEPEGAIPIWHLPGSPVFFYQAGMTIDADGAPNAYHPDNTGLDDLRNAGAPGHWEGLAKDKDGEPFVQGPDDPFPGYYVSETALADRSKAYNDPTRYVDASRIPFIVLPGYMARDVGARPGDFAAVINQSNGKSSYAIFGDIGPFDRIGEGSIALADNLGIRSDARNGGARRGILYVVFPGSGNGQPRSLDEINAETEKLLQDWGGSAQLTSCTAQPSDSVAGNRTVNTSTTEVDAKLP
jgi:hypothetical protein